ncbi:transposase [Streptomyces sp. ISL-10]|uniref:transposase n=1 Tax=Streptomyces sp. ISL-10 TaxID=2819172 RepID=UPI001BE8BF39|nr:transposase [Streptomyces sp. ISL-10]MBT2370301.1 transposase [Streptomyces sp. ISL-10]
MESMGKKKPRPRRSFTPEFKSEIVELCRRGDRSVGQVAKDFDLRSPEPPSMPAAVAGPVRGRSAMPS